MNGRQEQGVRGIFRGRKIDVLRIQRYLKDRMRIEEKKKVFAQISYADDDTCIFNCLNFEHVLELLCCRCMCERAFVLVLFSCVFVYTHACEWLERFAR